MILKKSQYFLLGRVSPANIIPVKLNAYQHSLVVGTHVEPE